MRRKTRTFRTKLYSTFMVSMIVPVTVIMILFLLHSNSSMMEQETTNITYVLKSICNSMEVQFTELENIGDTYYMQSEVFQEIESLNNPTLYAYYDELMRSSLETNYSITMTKMLHMSKQDLLDVVFFPINTEPQNAYYIDKNHANLEMIRVEGYEHEEWFTAALEADGAAVFYGRHMPEYREDKRKQEVYSCVRAIRNMDTKKTIGVIKIDAAIKNLQKSVDVIGQDTGDNIIISEGDAIITSVREIETDIIETDYKEGFNWIDGRAYYISTMKIPGTEWDLTYLFSMQNYYRSYVILVITAGIITITALGMALSIYRKSAKETVDDVTAITRGLKEIQKGNLDFQVRVKSKDEFYDIAEAINKMTENLKGYITKEYVWVINQQKAEYRALQAQINPHFLYNTLNGFIALNRMGETKKLEKSIIALTQLFRHICSNGDETTVGKECDFLKKYLELEKLKYEERLEYVVWVEEECEQKHIPRLLLQPIVENCIVHGMGNTDVPIMITIMVKSVMTNGLGKFMVITVRDNGIGFDKEQIEREGDHIGIDNVRIRAELYCKDVIYQCTSKQGEGTKTTFIFPDEVEKGET